MLTFMKNENKPFNNNEYQFFVCYKTLIIVLFLSLKNTRSMTITKVVLLVVYNTSNNTFLQTQFFAVIL